MKNSDELCKVREGLDVLQEQVTDHLEAINQNTSEIANNFEYSVNLEAKLDRLSERIDQLQLLVERHLSVNPTREAEFNVLPLTKREQEVFLILYTQEDSGPIAVEDLARHAMLPVEMVRESVTAMIAKGVPIVQRGVNGRVRLSLNQEFKRLQATKNILGLKQMALPMMND